MCGQPSKRGSAEIDDSRTEATPETGFLQQSPQHRMVGKVQMDPFADAKSAFC